MSIEPDPLAGLLPDATIALLRARWARQVQREARAVRENVVIAWDNKGHRTEARERDRQRAVLELFAAEEEFGGEGA